MPRVDKSINEVKVCIVIPCFNEDRYIGQCLDSLLDCSFDKDRMRILVVDGMSTDNTRSIVERYCREYENVVLVDNPRKIKPVALNIGVLESSEEIFIRIDAHATYEPDYVLKLVDGLLEYDADNIGGVRHTHLGKTRRSRVIGSVISHVFGAGNAYYRIGSDRTREVDTVFLGCYRRDVFERIGLFNEHLIRAQDREFNARLKAAGGRIVLEPSIECTYYPRDTLKEYCAWNLQGAYWLFLARGYSDTNMTSWRNIIPVAFILYNLALAALCLATRKRPGLTALPLYLYGLLLLLFSAQVTIRLRSVDAFPLAVLVFASTHYGYGLGAFCGLVGGTVLRYRKRPAGTA